MSALISPCGKYRYFLERSFNQGFFGSTKTCLFIMLNPSTADASEDDPTIRRCKGFAYKFECGNLVVVNLYAYRSTDPSVLDTVENPVGPHNDYYMSLEMEQSDLIICAWGANAKPDRISKVTELLKPFKDKTFCLGRTKDGHPKHPLYLSNECELLPFFD